MNSSPFPLEFDLQVALRFPSEGNQVHRPSLPQGFTEENAKIAAAMARSDHALSAPEWRPSLLRWRARVWELGDGDKSPAESGDQSPHSKALAHSVFGVRRVLAAFAAGRLVGLPGRVQRPDSTSGSDA